MKNKIDKNEILKMEITNGIISFDDVAERMEELNILDKHDNKIWQAKDGRWKTHIPDHTKKSGRRLIARKNKKDLEKTLIKYYENNVDKSVTVEELHLIWMQQRKSIVLEQTRARNQYHYNQYYKGTEIVRERIIDLTTLYIKNFFLTLIKENKMSYPKYTNVATVLKQGLEHAVELEIIERSPMQDLRIPRSAFAKKQKKKSKDEIFTEKEEAQIIKAVDNRRYYNSLGNLAIKLNFRLGLRVGELCALKWSDVNGRHLQIRRSEEEFKEVDIYGNIGKRTIRVVDNLKTAAGMRDLYLTKGALKILNEIKEISFSNGWYDKDGYIFVHKDGRIKRKGINDTFNNYTRLSDDVQTPLSVLITQT